MDLIMYFYKQKLTSVSYMSQEHAKEGSQYTELSIRKGTKLFCQQ